MIAALTPVSGNSKTGPIATSYSSEDTCPPSCGMREACYAKTGRVRIHWGKVNRGERGRPWADFCAQVAALLPGQIWRHNVAGDLPGRGERINGRMLRRLVQANRGRRGFTYTHKRPDVANNAEHIRHANDHGFTVNLSANHPGEVDALVAIGCGPVVTAMPEGSPDRQQTAGGNVIIRCLAESGNTNCSICQLCAKANRIDAQGRWLVVGFTAHGALKKYYNH